ncbi:MAG: DNA repair protein RecO [Asticcacaulis sp.]|uniref:DNA repair protein RecO n=1 Tax=Asticcacaulis sp. TaxID=1872648 RepID=UPI003F7C8FD9
MEFDDEAIVLGARLHGETGAVAHLLSESHGVWAAHVAGGASRRLKAALQPGARVQMQYQARNADHLGSARLEATAATPDLLDDPLALIGLQAACVMTRQVLPEREAHPGVYHALSALLGLMEMPEVWPAIYVRYEAGLLEAVGFGLDLSACAVTGGHDDLIFVSPKSGRAVSRAAGAPYRDKLLPLPGFMLSSQGGLGEGDIVNGLKLTGFFLERHVFHPHNQPLPEIRLRLADALS